jgi:hypothetical protein
MEPRDIVIVDRGMGPRQLYVLKTAASPEQILFRSYPDALARGRDVAARAHVDLWVVDREHAARIAHHRR